MIAILLKLAVVLSTLQSVTSDLSIPDPHDGHRASIIEARSKLIHNVERTYSVGDQTFQLNPGPEVSTSSMLYFEHLVLQATALTATTNFNASKIETFLQDRLPFTSVDDFHQAYEDLAATEMIEKTFGYADNLWEVPSDLILDVFGELTLSGALRTHKVFVTDFSDHGDLTYKAAKEFKYIPNVIGCFCNNVDKRQLLPLAITLVDSELTYTKADSPGEWQLAKMALHATEVNFQQMRHFVETHLISVPVQVEMMRSLSTEHPVYALMDYHLFADFGMEYFARRELLSPGTPYDQVTGYGATGSLRAVMREFKTTSVDLDLPTDLAARESLVDYRLNRGLWKYMKAYYTTKEAIRDDTELQTWAERSSQLEHIHGFPSAFTGYDDLVRVLTHFIFENAIKHHFMSGHASWHSIAPPFHGSALYNKPLPTKKGEEVDPLDWFRARLCLRWQPFTSETELVEPIREFHQSMNDMMHFVDFAESQEAHPIDIFKPSSLPFYSFT
ncbi:Lipoxygenase [Phytophthora infestans]|uniref:Lipoxygenase n=1 Tax=Phytophthora infestans TaxID=4787 RepID=A0A833TCH7_PHYIN|nr:Lipoxygenase [Phytophthora infestans]